MWGDVLNSVLIDVYYLKAYHLRNTYILPSTALKGRSPFYSPLYELLNGLGKDGGNAGYEMRTFDSAG